MEYIYYLIIIALLLIIAFAITNSKRKDFKIEANKLVEYLGGKQNIIKYECNLLSSPINYCLNIHMTCKRTCANETKAYPTICNQLFTLTEDTLKVNAEKL